MNKYAILFTCIITMIVIFLFISYHDNVLIKLGYSTTDLNLFTPDTVMTYIVLLSGWILVFYYMYKNIDKLPKAMTTGITVLLALSSTIFIIGTIVLYKASTSAAMSSFDVIAILIGLIGTCISVGYIMYSSKSYGMGIISMVPLVYYMLWLAISYIRVDNTIWTSGY